jgi:hypothetical protein
VALVLARALALNIHSGIAIEASTRGPATMDMFATSVKRPRRLPSATAGRRPWNRRTGTLPQRLWEGNRPKLLFCLLIAGSFLVKPSVADNAQGPGARNCRCSKAQSGRSWPLNLQSTAVIWFTEQRNSYKSRRLGW